VALDGIKSTNDQMPRLKSLRRERFATEVASMTPYASAYVASGYADSPWAAYNANKLAHVPEVAGRIRELQAEFQARAGIKLEYLQAQLLRIVEARPHADPKRLHEVATKLTFDEDGKQRAAEVNRMDAIVALIRSIGGFTDRVESTTDISIGLGARLDAALAKKWENGAPVIEHRPAAAFAPSEVGISVGKNGAAPESESFQYQSADTCSASELELPLASPSRPGRSLFLRYAAVRAGGMPPLQPEFQRLPGSTRDALIRYVSPVRGETQRPGAPSTPAAVAACLDRFAPCELDELLNVMANDREFQKFLSDGGGYR
jgi:hypothetical protein